MTARSLTSAILIFSAICLGLVACSAKKEPAAPQAPPVFTYASSDITPWPWRVQLITITCTDLGGSSTAVINGKTYGLTGRDAIHSRIRGYESYSPLLSNPDAGYDTTLAFDARVELDCKNAYRARGEDVPG